MSGKELCVRFTASPFRKLLSFFVFSYFPIGFAGVIWDLTVSVPDHCLSFYFRYYVFSVFVIFRSIYFSKIVLVNVKTTSLKFLSLFIYA